MLSTSERIEPVPAGQAVNEQELKQVKYRSSGDITAL